MKFKITNLTDGTVPFSAGSVLQPGTSRPVEVISLELKRLESRGIVKIDPMPDVIGSPPDLKADYEPDVRPPVGVDAAGIPDGKVLSAQGGVAVWVDPPASSGGGTDSAGVVVQQFSTVVGKNFYLNMFGQEGSELSYTVDWGDGSTVETGSTMGGGELITLFHQYQTSNSFLVSWSRTIGQETVSGKFYVTALDSAFSAKDAQKVQQLWDTLFNAGFILPDVSDFTFTQNGLDVSVTAVTPLTPLAVGVDTYVAIDWGDGTPEGSSLMGPWNHTYAQDGTYQVRVRYAGNWNTFGGPVTKTLSVAD